MGLGGSHYILFIGRRLLAGLGGMEYPPRERGTWELSPGKSVSLHLFVWRIFVMFYKNQFLFQGRDLPLLDSPQFQKNEIKSRESGAMLTGQQYTQQFNIQPSTHWLVSPHSQGSKWHSGTMALALASKSLGFKPQGLPVPNKLFWSTRGTAGIAFPLTLPTMINHMHKSGSK